MLKSLIVTAPGARSCFVIGGSKSLKCIGATGQLLGIKTDANGPVYIVKESELVYNVRYCEWSDL